MGAKKVANKFVFADSIPYPPPPLTTPHHKSSEQTGLLKVYILV